MMKTLDAIKDKLAAKYQKFTAEMKEAEADARIQSHVKYGEFQSAKNDFETTWNEFVQTTEEKGEEMKEKAEEKYKEMQLKWDELKENIS